MIEGIIISAPLYVALFWSLLFILDYREHRNLIMLSLTHFMLTTFALYVCHYVYFSYAGQVGSGVEILYRYCNLAVYPLYYIYLRRLTLRPLPIRTSALLLLPAVAVALLALKWPQGAAVIGKVLFAAQVIAVAVLGTLSLRQFERLVAANYSDPENRSLTNIRNLLFFFVLTSAVSFLINLFGRERFVESPFLLAIPSLVFSTMVFLLGYMGLHEMSTVKEVQLDMMQDVGAVESSWNPDETMTDGAEKGDTEKFEELTLRIRSIMDEEKLFLQPNLKINDLALRLNSNRNYIYKAVNVGMGLSFSDYVNRKRIDYAISCMENNRDIALLDVCTMSGFTSLSAFYRNFKSYKGCSPAEFMAREQHS